MAGALHVQLGGATIYDGVRHERPTFGTGHAPGPSDLRRGLMFYLGACWVMWLMLLLGGLL